MTVMASVWLASVRRGLDEALELLTVAVRECPDQLWRMPMWRVQASEIIADIRDADGRPVSVPGQRDALIQRWSTPWSVAWHALEVLDYDLAGELAAWAPPLPFTGKPHWQTFTSLPAAWSQVEISGYIEYRRHRVRDTFVDLTEEKAAVMMPPTHRYAGHPYASIVTSLIGHTTAHATQIRQFVTTFGSTNTPS